MARGEPAINAAALSACARIAILGGDLHAWCAAAMLSKALGPHGVSITVIDTEPTIAPGVIGGHPAIHQLHQALGVREVDLIRSMPAAYRYGTAFIGWNGPADPAVFSFGPSGQSLDRVDFHHFAARLRRRRPELDLAGFSLAAMAGSLGRFSHPEAGSALAGLEYAPQFDRTAYRQFLMAFAVDHGVERRCGRLAEVEMQAQGEAIAKLRLQDQSEVEADFYFDCSGQEASLIEGALKLGFESWQELFGCDHLIELRARSTAPTPLFDAFACTPLGWQRDRFLPGLVCRQQRVCADALEPLQWAELKTSPNGVQALRAGRRRQFWKANCLALGHSAGYVEEFLFDDLHPTIGALRRWLELLPGAVPHPRLREQYNRATHEAFERVRDAHAFPLWVAAGSAAAPWAPARNSSVWPASLLHRIELFRETGRVAFYENDPLAPHQWAMLLAVLGLWPQRVDVLMPELADAELERRLLEMAQAVLQQARKLPMHDELLAAIRQAPAKPAGQGGAASG